MDSKKVSLITLCQSSKAFDSVSHEVLLTKCLNVKTDSFCFQNYLSNRTQSVRINNSMSDSSRISYGVPQGSVLGSVLLTVYVNDFWCYSSNYQIIQYADDIQFIHSGYIE